MNLPFEINVKGNCRQIFLLWFFTTSILSSAKAIDVPPDKEPLLSVNGYAVSIEEFRWFMQQQRAGVFQYVKTRYNLDYGKGFWDHDCGQTTPRAIILKQTTDRIVREKIEQILFVKLGLVKDINYVTFLRDLERLNIQRTAAINRGQVIYGPVNYTQLQYYGHWMANLQIQAKEKLSLERFVVTEQKLKAFYAEHKDEFFKKAATVTLEVVTIQAEQKSDSGKKTELLDSTAGEIFSQIEAGHDIKQIILGYVDRKDVKVSCRRFDEVNDDRLSEVFADSDDFKKVKALAPCQGAVLSTSESTRHVAKCISKTPGNYLPYEGIKSIVKAKYIDQRYDQFINEMVKKAAIKVNQKVLEKIELQ